MRKIRLWPVLAAAAILMPLAPVQGHHSFAMFDQSKKLVLKGKVAEFQWTNPHSYIELDVADGGKTTRWSIELNSPNNLKRQGWHRDSVKPGDEVAVTLNPLRNGKPGGLFNSVVLPSGKVLAEAAFASGKPINTPGGN